MTVCYFGFYNPDYSRNRVLMRGLAHNGVTVVECRSDARGIGKYVELIRKHRALRKKYDVIIVGFPGYQAMLLARLLTRKPIIFDAFSPLYDSMVHDRKLAKPGSAKAWYYWALDYLSMRFADLVLFDTNEHIDYVSAEFSVPRKKLKRIFVGSSPEVYPVRNKPLQAAAAALPAERISNGVYSPQAPPFARGQGVHSPKQPSLSTHGQRAGQAPRKAAASFTALFFGTFIPLHGVEYIIEAAKLLEDEGVMFHIIGDGQEKEKIVRLTGALNVKNIEFAGAVGERELASLIANADVCLGIFGNTQKAARVIPNKVYAYAAMRKPIITGDTSAIRELFDEHDMLLVPVADAKALAAGMLKLKSDSAMMERFAKNAHGKFIKYATPDVLGLSLKQMLKDLVSFKK